MSRKRLESMTEDELMVAELIQIIRCERLRSKHPDEEAIKDCYDLISEIMEIPLDEVVITMEEKIREEKRHRRLNKLLWIGVVIAAIGVVSWRVYCLF